MPLTKRQRQILDFLTSYAGEHGYAPSFEEIAEQFNYNSLATVHEIPKYSIHFSILQSNQSVATAPYSSIGALLQTLQVDLYQLAWSLLNIDLVLPLV